MDQGTERVNVLVYKNGQWEVAYYNLTRSDAKHMVSVLGMQGYSVKTQDKLGTDIREQ